MNEYTVVVAIANPANVAALMSVGCMTANEHDGRVVAVTVVEMDCEAPPRSPKCHDRMSAAYDVLDRAEETADQWGTECDGRLAVGRKVHEVLSEVADAEEAAVIVVGFSEREHPEGDDVEFDRLVDEIAADAPCNVVVARFKGQGRCGRVLVPVRSRLNLDVRRDLVSAMHHQLGTRVDVIHFACSEQEAAEMQARLAEWLKERGVSDWAVLHVQVRDDPAEAIVEASEDYDAIVLGTAPLHEVRRRFFGAVPEYVASHAKCSTFLVRTQGIAPGN
jgi:nucleotide-binding universal stress UspA family protein